MVVYKALRAPGVSKVVQYRIVFSTYMVLNTVQDSVQGQHVGAKTPQLFIRFRLFLFDKNNVL